MAKVCLKAEINEVNDELYLELATKIAILRNERIRSSKEQLKGFKISEDDTNVEAVYHVLMPSKKGMSLRCMWVKHHTLKLI